MKERIKNFIAYEMGDKLGLITIVVMAVVIVSVFIIGSIM